MIIDCISDLHGNLPQLPGGDVLIVAGDAIWDHTNSSEEMEFLSWLQYQKYSKKIFIAGNHDRWLMGVRPNNFDQWDVTYLMDSGTEYEGIKFWGSPWTIPYGDWFFMATEEELEGIFDKIPSDTDILITHSPPYGILDQNIYQTHCGSYSLLAKIQQIKPKFHVFGHIHEAHGQKKIKDNPTTFINCAHMDQFYMSKNEPVRIVL